MGRPRKKIDAKQVDRLAMMHCTYEEIAAVVECSTDTLKRRFADRIQKGRERGKTSLRRGQFKAAMKGNPTMLIWLGKQLLGQTDHSEDNAHLTGGATDPAETARAVRVAVREMESATAGHRDGGGVEG